MSPLYTYNHTPENLSTLLTSLSHHDIAHTSDATTRSSVSNTPHSPAPPSQQPSLVFFPTSTQQTSLILSACHSLNIAVTSHSGGTSMSGALTAIHGGISISFSRMKSIIALHQDDLNVTVQPGLGWVELNAAIVHTGLFFPVDPAPGAAIGGMVAMSCSGTNAYRYGTMKEWVVAVTVVLADGRVVKTKRRPRKSSAGYDLTHLVIGSEGTLGLVTEVVLRLAPLPKDVHVGIVTFDTFDQGVQVVVRLQGMGVRVEALELADGEQMYAINASGVAKERFQEKPTLFVKFVEAQREVVEQVCKACGALSYEFTGEKRRMDELWAVRKSIAHSVVAMKKDPSDLFMHSDCAVPISNLARFVAGAQELVQEVNSKDGHGWFCSTVGHVGDGNTHLSIVCPEKDREAAEEVLRKVMRFALSLEGTITGEHGVGLKLRDALVEEVGEVGVDVMRAIKRSVDEKGILNPDKVFRLEASQNSKAKI